MSLTIAYESAFVPPEWIAAHGCEPTRITAGLGAVRAPEGACPYAQSIIQRAATDKPDALILTTICDQFRRGSEQPELADACPVFLMNLPATWQTPAAVRLYRHELERLSRFLVKLGADVLTPDNLVFTLDRYDKARTELRALAGTVRPREFTEALHRFHDNGSLTQSSTFIPSCVTPNHIALGLIGGPLPPGGMKLFDWVSAHGGRIVVDGTENGERTLPATINRRILREDPFSTLCESYFGTIPAIWQRPNNRFYLWLKQMITERHLRGLILYRHLWCDLWHAEVGRIRDWSPIPLVEIDVDDTDDSGLTERHRTRIEAFIEMLS